MAPAEPMLPAELAPERASYSGRPSSSSVRSARSTARMLEPSSLLSSSSLSSPPSARGAAAGFRARIGLAGVARRTLGISLLMVTVFLWTASNFLASVS